MVILVDESGSVRMSGPSGGVSDEKRCCDGAGSHGGSSRAIG